LDQFTKSISESQTTTTSANVNLYANQRTQSRMSIGLDLML